MAPAACEGDLSHPNPVRERQNKEEEAAEKAAGETKIAEAASEKGRKVAQATTQEGDERASARGLSGLPTVASKRAGEEMECKQGVKRKLWDNFSFVAMSAGRCTDAVLSSCTSQSHPTAALPVTPAAMDTLDANVDALPTASEDADTGGRGAGGKVGTPAKQFKWEAGKLVHALKRQEGGLEHKEKQHKLPERHDHAAESLNLNAGDTVKLERGPNGIMTGNNEQIAVPDVAVMETAIFEARENGERGEGRGKEATEGTQEERQVAIKLRLNDRWFRWRASNMQAIMEHIKEKLRPQNSRFEIFYFDDEQDSVFLDSEADFQEAVKIMCVKNGEGGEGMDIPLKIHVNVV